MKITQILAACGTILLPIALHAQNNGANASPTSAEANATMGTNTQPSPSPMPSASPGPTTAPGTPSPLKNQ